MTYNHFSFLADKKQPKYGVQIHGYLVSVVYDVMVKLCSPVCLDKNDISMYKLRPSLISLYICAHTVDLSAPGGFLYNTGTVSSGDFEESRFLFLPVFFQNFGIIH